ncbi:ATP-binding protein [Hansschlegelia sp. KR7-227]|uniref:hybrid sensor histidine kinase/response regulator n=1 Tax=Hansschlegelia sp. KR7-227 TaxID=3400914 RepID=UPI003C0ACC10
MSDKLGDWTGEQPVPRQSGWRLVLKGMLSAIPRSANGEHEIVLNRVWASLLILAYTSMNPSASEPAHILAIVYASCAGLFFAHLWLRPGRQRARRLAGMLVDCWLLSYGLHLGGDVTAVLFPFYLWIIFGNGFRFGVQALGATAVAAIAGFSAVIATTAFWSQNLPLSIGLLSSLVVLPAYAGTLISKLSRAKSAAEQASRAKSLFLASVSHELRTPLNAVIGMTELLEGTRLDDEQRDMARTAGDAGRALLGLIDELLKFSRLEAGRMPVQIGDFDLHALVVEARDMLVNQARAKNLRLGVHVTPRTPYALRGDARQIRDVLINLAGNAVKFTETGGISIAVDALGSSADGRQRLRFEVADTGVGVAPAARSRIFESFTQADETVINSHGGTGLGLAICKQSVELMGGRIGVESTPGFGSTFWFELELPAASTEDLSRGPAPARVLALAASTERAEALVATLGEAGVTAAAAVGVRQAVGVLKAGAPGPRSRFVVVADGRGAVPDGEALIAALRAATERDAFEAALIDTHMDDGLPDLDLRLACTATLRPDPDREALQRALRFAAVSAAAIGARQAPSTAPVTAARRLSILVAEDNRTNQKVISKVLERAGHEVRLADNGELALDALTERAFDLVLMDVNMPVLDGIECTKLYRFASIGKKRVPIVALTADATPEARARCEEAGMDACLHKPIEPDRLIAIIDEIVGLGNLPSEAPAQPGDTDAEIAAEVVDDDIVANISKHPGFRPARRAVVDRRTLQELEELGGRDFVNDLVAEFIGDAALVLRALHEAVDRGEPAVFRDQAHALRSGAANIGARGMYEICLSLRNLDAHALAQEGAEHVRRLETEFERVSKTLKRQYAVRGAAARD